LQFYHPRPERGEEHQMADDTPGTPTGETIGSEQQTHTDADTATAQTQAGEMVSRAEADKAAAAARRDAEAKAKEVQRQLDAATARLKELEDEKTEAERAKLDEAERLKLEAEEAKQERDRAIAQAQSAQVEAMRTRLIMEQAPSLPVAYKRLVEGDDEAAITASIAAAQEQYQSDNADKLDIAGLAAARGMTPEDRLAKYGDAAGAKLNEFFKQQPQSVGTPSNQPGQPGARADDAQRAAQLAEIQKITDPAARQKAFREHVEGAYR